MIFWFYNRLGKYVNSLFWGGDGKFYGFNRFWTVALKRCKIFTGFQVFGFYPIPSPAFVIEFRSCNSVQLIYLFVSYVITFRENCYGVHLSDMSLTHDLCFPLKWFFPPGRDGWIWFLWVLWSGRGGCNCQAVFEDCLVEVRS